MQLNRVRFRVAGRFFASSVICLGGVAAGADFVGVGRTDILKGAPFIKTYTKTRPTGAIAIFPAILDPISTDGPEDGVRNQALRVLADELDRYIQSLEWVHPVDFQPPGRGVPVAYAGVSDGEYAPAGATTGFDDEKRPPMILYAQKPSAAWRAELSSQLDAHDLQGAIVVAIGFSEFPKSYRTTFKKRVLLGTGYEADIRFLSAEFEPVHVLYVTGMFLDRDGSIVSAAAEGVLSEDTSFWAQSFGVRKEIDTNSVLKALDEERRDDLPGNPLKLHVAVHNLLAQLLGEPATLIVR